MNVLGIGTGRCGTTSLAHLLDGCRGCKVYHEMGAPAAALSWDFDSEAAQSKLEQLRRLKGIVTGDVAFYYLNYVPFFFECLEDLRIIHIYRGKSEVIRSFMSKTPDRNHWMPGDATTRPDPHWDSCFPNYPNANTKEEGSANMSMTTWERSQT